jgi:hypothetical protein
LPRIIVQIGAAAVPPIALLAAVHGIALAVRAGASGRVYFWAVSAVAAIGAGAFAMSFLALRDLMRAIGYTSATAWAFPAIIDTAVAVATVMLVALGDKPARRSRTTITAVNTQHPARQPTAQNAKRQVIPVRCAQSASVDQPHGPRSLCRIGPDVRKPWPTTPQGPARRGRCLPGHATNDRPNAVAAATLFSFGFRAPQAAANAVRPRTEPATLSAALRREGDELDELAIAVVEAKVTRQPVEVIRAMLESEGERSLNRTAKDIRVHLVDHTGPGTVTNHARLAEEAEDTLEGFVAADVTRFANGDNSQFVLFLSYAKDVIDRLWPTARLPDGQCARSRGRTGTELQRADAGSGPGRPCFIWPNLDPFKQQQNLLDAVPAR